MSPEDIHVYSIDEVFMDITKYLSTSKMTPKEFASQILLDIYDSTGLTATAGIGTNLYLSKVAMDIVIKHINTDQNGLRIALLNEKDIVNTFGTIDLLLIFGVWEKDMLKN